MEDSEALWITKTGQGSLLAAMAQNFFSQSKQGTNLSGKLRSETVAEILEESLYTCIWKRAKLTWLSLLPSGTCQ